MKLINVLSYRMPSIVKFKNRKNVSRYQKGKTNLYLLEQETVSGNGISWAICKSAPCPRQVAMPPSYHSLSQATASKH